MTVDPILFEVLRHRLCAINEEAASAIARISGSPVANEAYDFNTGLMTPTGQVLIVGPYVMAHAAALDGIVEYIIENYSDNPGINEGDMFATNDPYVGANHQADVAVVSPIFHGGQVVLWCGSIVHQTDVGGPVAGSVNASALSIYQEAIPLAPIKMVEGGRLRKDLEREYVIRSRTPGLNALDLRGQIASNRSQATRVREICDLYGRDSVTAVVNHLVETTEQRFRERLHSLPDGTWSAQTFVEHDGQSDAVYLIDLTMTKTGDHLDLDFSESSPQAPAVINCSRGAFRGYILGTLLTLLGFDFSWTPAGIWPAVTLHTTPGTIVDPTWPAGVAVGNQASGIGVRTVVNRCVSQLLDGSADHSDRAMAPSMGTYAGQNISGLRADGARFGTMLMDSMSGGMGARAFADGVDTGGMLTAPKSSIGNIEVNEHNYPILYLWRREAVDSGGPGRFRGGLSGEHAYVPHNACGAFESTQFGQGVEFPSSPGILGGEPGSVNVYLCVRGGRNLNATKVEDLDGVREVLAAKGTTNLEPNDVFVQAYAGGGGLGDPLDRDVSRVVADVRAGAVSIAAARAVYGVELAEGDGDVRVDEQATERTREERRRARLGGRRPAPARPAPPDGRRLSSALTVLGDDGRGMVACSRCHQVLAAVGEPLLPALAAEAEPVSRRWTTAGYLPGSRRFVFERFHCPGCARQLETRIRLLDGDASGAEPSPTP